MVVRCFGLGLTPLLTIFQLYHGGKMFRFIQVKLVMIFYFETLFKVWFIQNSILYRVQFRQVLLLMTLSTVLILFSRCSRIKTETREIDE
jgi:hypothetical protein